MSTPRDAFLAANTSTGLHTEPEGETLDADDSSQEHKSSKASAVTTSQIPMNIEPMAAPVVCAVSVNSESS